MGLSNHAHLVHEMGLTFSLYNLLSYLHIMGCETLILAEQWKFTSA